MLKTGPELPANALMDAREGQGYYTRAFSSAPNCWERPYSPSYAEGVFSEVGLPLYGVSEVRARLRMVASCIRWKG
jgi:hypothetical protein